MSSMRQSVGGRQKKVTVLPFRSFPCGRKDHDLLVPVNDCLLNVDSFRNKSPAFALLVLVAIQTPAGRPHGAGESSFIDRTDPHMGLTSRRRTERNTEARAGSHKLI